MTCRNCIHSEICSDANVDQGEFINNHVECMCVNFEDKRLFVKLPCKIGAVVYEVIEYDDCDNHGCYCCDGIADLVDKDCQYHIKRREVIERFFALQDVECFGKSIFLKREEAERKLQDLIVGDK